MIDCIAVSLDQVLLPLGIPSILLKIGGKRSKEMLFELSIAPCLAPIIYGQRG
jgi:hypothetical protein